MFLECLNNITYLSYNKICLFFLYMKWYIVYASHFFHCLQFNLDETWYEACSKLVRFIYYYVSQLNTYIAYQLLITITVLITIKEESYLIVSKIVSLLSMVKIEKWRIKPGVYPLNKN